MIRTAPGFSVHLVPDAKKPNGLYDYVKSIEPASIICTDPAQACQLLDNAHEPSLRILILHFSGYGYATNGAPLKLVRLLEQWRRASAHNRLLVVFHELFVNLPPWRKGFWWAPLQRHVLQRLINCCDGGLSTLERHSRWLRSHGLEPFATLAVPSNVGETSEPLPLHQRSRQLLVFGGRSQRQAAHFALQRHTELLARLGIRAIHDLGPPLDLPPSLAGLPLYSHGLLPVAQVAELLKQTQLAAVSYPLPFLAKSGIFAAICAHGALPLVLNAGRTEKAQADGLRAGLTYITPAWVQAQPDASAAVSADQRIATAAWQWYQLHRLSEQRRQFQAWISAPREGLQVPLL